MATSNSTPTPADTVAIELYGGFVITIPSSELGEARSLGRQMLDVVESAVAAGGEVETDPSSLWAVLRAARSLTDAAAQASPKGGAA